MPMAGGSTSKKTPIHTQFNFGPEPLSALPKLYFTQTRKLKENPGLGGEAVPTN
jgi:hypothetical protein